MQPPPVQQQPVPMQSLDTLTTTCLRRGKENGGEVRAYHYMACRHVRCLQWAMFDAVRWCIDYHDRLLILIGTQLNSRSLITLCMLACCICLQANGVPLNKVQQRAAQRSTHMQGPLRRASALLPLFAASRPQFVLNPSANIISVPYAQGARAAREAGDDSGVEHVKGYAVGGKRSSEAVCASGAPSAVGG
jgi:hypothetical protein